mgnify:CR=1 FL=1
MTLSRRAVLAGGAGLGMIALSGVALTLLRHPAGAEGLTLDDVIGDPDQPVLGNPEGDVTVVEFFDYQCPFCKRGHSDLLAEVSDDGNARLVMKDWPIFGGASVLASQLVLGAVNTDQYAHAQNALMATPARLSEQDVRDTLAGAGLDPDSLYASYLQERSRWDGLLGRNSQQAVAIGLQGTPAYNIGQSMYPGAMERSRLRDAIAHARNEA